MIAAVHAGAFVIRKLWLELRHECFTRWTFSSFTSQPDVRTRHEKVQRPPKNHLVTKQARNGFTATAADFEAAAQEAPSPAREYISFKFHEGDP